MTTGPSLLFEPHQTILFIGDSITDAFRIYENPCDLGHGYASIAAALASCHLAEYGLTFLNRGISGNRVTDLAERWDRDCLALKPDWVSILIGANDTWRRYDSDLPMTTEEFEATYRTILERAKTAGIRIILCEPFLLQAGEQVQWHWREDMDPKIQAVRRLASEFAEAYVPFDGAFASACQRAEPAYWAADGVHPTSAGHGLMAREWLRANGIGA